MSELLSAVASNLGVPEALAQRSAEARAAAEGVDVDEILQAWSGGAVPAPVSGAAAAAPPPSDPDPVAEASEPAPEALEAEPASENGSGIEAPEPLSAPDDEGTVAGDAHAAREEPVEVGVAAAVAGGPNGDIEPAPLRSRLLLPAALGAAAGVPFAFITAAVGTVFFVDNAGTVVAGDASRAAVEMQVLPVVIGMALLGAVFGGLLGVLGRSGPSLFQPDLAVVGGAGIVVGAVVGLILGGASGGALVALLGEETLEEGILAVPVAPALWLLLIGGAAVAALNAVVAHVTAVPAGLSAGDLADTGEVRTRLRQSILLPLTAILLLVLVIGVFAALFLLFHAAAPALAIVISAGILLFAFLGGYRPNIRLRYTEIMAALAGIATVVFAIIMVVLVREGH